MFSDRLPAKVRKVIYGSLEVAFAVETVFNILEDGLEGRLLTLLAMLGFRLARKRTTDIIVVAG